MSKIVYQWVKVSDLKTGLHIHLDIEPSNRVPDSDWRVTSIKSVGKDVIEIRVHRSVLGNVEMVLHRKPTDEVSVFGVQDE